MGSAGLGSPPGARDPGGHAMIPSRIHHVWLGATGDRPPEAAREAAQTWREHHPEAEHRLWGSDEIEALFHRVRPDFLDLFRGYPRWVQRADAARYLILHEEGGIYADHDIRCRASWAPLLRRHAAIVAPTWPVGVSNDLMASEAGHPLMAAVLDELPAAARRWDRGWIPPHLRVLASTGSLLLTSVLRRGSWPGLRLLDPEEYGAGDTGSALVRHVAGGSWHDWDGRILARADGLWNVLRGRRARGRRRGEDQG